MTLAVTTTLPPFWTKSTLPTAALPLVASSAAVAEGPLAVMVAQPVASRPIAASPIHRFMMPPR